MRCGNCRKPMGEHDEHCSSCGSHRPSPATRKVMRANKSKNTGPELALAAALRRRGLRPKRHDSLRPGTPDFAFPSSRIAVFVDGEFWHGRGPKPKTNAEWWAAKFARTIERDERNERELVAMGWIVVRFTDKQVKASPDGCAAIVGEVYNGSRSEHAA